MAADDHNRAKFLLIIISFLVNSELSLESEALHGVTSIQVTKEDGSEQLFKVKHLELDWAEGTCDFCHPDQLPPTQTSEQFFGDFHQQPQWRPTVVLPIGGIANCDPRPHDAPFGLCSEKTKMEGSVPYSMESVQEYADIIVDLGMVPLATGITEVDSKIAYGIVLLNSGFADEALEHFVSLITDHPDVAAGYHGKAAVYTRLGLGKGSNAKLALEEYTQAYTANPKEIASLERKAEILVPLGRHAEALQVIDEALQTHSTGRLYYLRGIVMITQVNLEEAEKNFRSAARMEDSNKLLALVQLANIMYQRGKVRNAIEVYKDILELSTEHLDSHIGLGLAYRDLGNIKLAEQMFTRAVELEPESAVAKQLRGHLFYKIGNVQQALEDFQKCLELARDNVACQTMLGVCAMSQGAFYKAVKAHTKVMVSEAKPNMKISPEFLKVHYLREYSRYLHAHLDDDVMELNPDADLPADFKDHWINQMPFSFKSDYKEQPGLQPHIRDVFISDFHTYPAETRQLVCYAYKVGQTTNLDTDGYLASSRLQLAMGFAAIHIGQTIELLIRDWRINKLNGTLLKWKEVFNLAVPYLRLVEPDVPIFWHDQMPSDSYYPPFTNTIYMIRQHTTNIQVASYFELVFKLVKTMVEHYTVDDLENQRSLKDEVPDAKTCDDLLRILKKSELKQHVFMVSTQVPSLKDRKHIRHEGFIFTLAEDSKERPILSLHVPTTVARTASYSDEMEYILDEFYQSLKKTAANNMVVSNFTVQSEDVDALINLIMSLVYYFHNLMPLSNGSSVVATSVAIGLLLSLGREVNIHTPKGKLWEMEAILSGAPETFQMGTKNWMTLKNMDSPVSSLPLVSETFPTVRSLLEVLNSASVADC